MDGVLASHEARVDTCIVGKIFYGRPQEDDTGCGPACPGGTSVEPPISEDPHWAFVLWLQRFSQACEEQLFKAHA
jgi:hypothetical protein